MCSLAPHAPHPAADGCEAGGDTGNDDCDDASPCLLCLTQALVQAGLLAHRRPEPNHPGGPCTGGRRQCAGEAVPRDRPQAGSITGWWHQGMMCHLLTLLHIDQHTASELQNGTNDSDHCCRSTARHSAGHRQRAVPQRQPMRHQ